MDLSDKTDFKEHYKRQRKLWHNVQGVNPRRRHNNYKYICTQHRSILICKANSKIHKRGNSNTVIVRDFNTLLSSRDRVSRQKLNKETQALNDIFHQVDLTDVYRAFHSKATGYTFFSNAHETFWATNQALINLRKLNPYQTYFPITMLWD